MRRKWLSALTCGAVLAACNVDRLEIQVVESLTDGGSAGGSAVPTAGRGGQTPLGGSGSGGGGGTSPTLEAGSAGRPSQGGTPELAVGGGGGGSTADAGEPPVGGGGGGSTADAGEPPVGGGRGGGGAPTCEADLDTDPLNCGTCGLECGTGQTCNHGDCEDPPDHCTDNERNEDETDTDCGGEDCARCLDGSECEEDTDCVSEFCDLLASPVPVCAAPTCPDRSQNGGETDIDCGGVNCRLQRFLCDNGGDCSEDGDCASAFCLSGTCATPTCDDEVLNNNETAPDCGGPQCRAEGKLCQNEQECLIDDDCSSLYCTAAGECTTPTCNDDVRNQDETGVDCGGGEACSPCPDGQPCEQNRDCTSDFCSPSQLCSPAGCNNSNQDAGESDVDCGGTACRDTRKCDLGDSCDIHADCDSGSCPSGQCVPPTCSDTVRNQGETAVDCGGDICVAEGRLCANTLACETDRDCQSEYCQNDRCSGACTGLGPTEGCPCNSTGVVCAGENQRGRLTCDGSRWISAGQCPSGQNCSGGTCAAIIPQCTSPGTRFCAGLDELHTCNEDRTATTSATCDGVCTGATSCQSPRCGDNKLHDGEACDDGNETPLDGCEPEICEPSRVESLTLGSGQTCALMHGGYVRCWGDNSAGQLGLGHTGFQADRPPADLTDEDGQPAGPVALAGRATQIDAGTAFTCALLEDGSVQCWGSNSKGQLGQGNFAEMPNEIVTVSLGGTATRISAGGSVACAVRTTGDVVCWGDNSVGTLGRGSLTQFSQSQTPGQIGAVPLGSATVLDVAVGGDHMCALITTGGTQAARCWGLNLEGQVGIGSSTGANQAIGDAETPTVNVPFPSGRYPLTLFAGAAHSCALMDNSMMQCWGNQGNGQLGTGTQYNRGDDEPATTGATQTGTTVTKIVAAGSFTCARFGSNWRCWGRNAEGQLGYGDTTQRGKDNTPASLSNIDFGGTADDMFLGTSHGCALLSGGEVTCWGQNSGGQLGLGNTSSAPSYVLGPPAGLPRVEVY